jgi:hypothetical protein
VGENQNVVRVGLDGIGGSTGDPMGDSTGDSMPIDRVCSSYNQKKPPIDFGRFLTYNPYRQRNRKANQAYHLKQRALLNNKALPLPLKVYYPNNLACKIRAKSELDGPPQAPGPDSDFSAAALISYYSY